MTNKTEQVKGNKQLLLTNHDETLTVNSSKSGQLEHATYLSHKVEPRHNTKLNLSTVSQNSMKNPDITSPSEMADPL